MIGDGSAALHGAKTLTQFAERVYFIPLKEIEGLNEELEGFPIEVIPEKPLDILGENEVKGLVFEGEKILEVDGIFIEIGAKGALELIAPLGVELDPETFSYVKVDRRMQTSVEGIFACGDLTGPLFSLPKQLEKVALLEFLPSEYIKNKNSAP